MKHVLAGAALAALAAAAPASSQAADPMLLKFAFLAPPTTWVNTMGAKPYVEEVMQAAQGTIDIKMFFGTQLGTVRNIYDRTVAGAAEIAFGTFGELSEFKKTNVTTLPFETDDCYEAATALWKLYTSGVIADEYTKIKPLVLFTFPGYVLSSKQPIKTMDDLQGTKIIATSRITSQGLQLLGATPITLIPTEMYQAIQRGTADGTIVSWAAITVFKVDELTRHEVDTPFGHGPTYFFMNKEAYAKLPAVAKTAFDRYSGDPLNQRLAKSGAKVQEDAAGVLKARGHTISTLDPQVAQEWRRRIAPITEEWVKDTPSGAAVLAAYRKEIAAARAAKR